MDARCTQIAAFALAFAAWKAGGYRQLPVPNIACSGIAVVGQLETWTRLAGDDTNLRMTLERHYQLFRNAPDLGSLINPNDVPLQDRMFSADYAHVEPLLRQALMKERVHNDPVSSIFGAAAEGVARAARLLAGTYTLVATNVPYLTYAKQSETLKRFCELHYPVAKADLATAFIERCRAFVSHYGTYAVVTPQNWLFLGSYRYLRERELREQCWELIAKLDEGAFESSAAAGAFTILLILSNRSPSENQTITCIDASIPRTPHEKANLLKLMPPQIIEQKSQLRNPDCRILFSELTSTPLLANYADSYEGIGCGDLVRFSRYFWELKILEPEWRLLRGTTNETNSSSGLESVIFWQDGRGEIYQLAKALRDRLKNTWQRGNQAWGKQGIAINRMRDLYAERYFGEIFDSNIAAVIPINQDHLAAIWHFIRSSDFRHEVRKIDPSLKVTNVTFLKVPFNLQHWQKIADAAGPLTEPYSNAPTQWLFNGSPSESTESLQVAVARLLGYHWPQQKSDDLDTYSVKDGIICLSPISGEERAAELLRALLAQTYGEAWSPMEQERLLAGAGFGGKSLDVWLHDGFFTQHCSLFHNRPFIWHIWDGLKEGFSALVNYHQLDAARLDRLIYTYLGSWITTQRAERDAGVSGAEARLVAAINLQKKLEAIRDGEKPYDIYVRWKPLHEQPMGWNPDLNDGVRINIRPFVTAGVLRNRFTINWNKDRGTNPDGSERLNDIHYTVAEKREARQVTIQ